MLACPGRPVKGARVPGQALHDLVSSGAATTADQAHLTCTMRAYAGHTPSALRRLLHR